MDNTRTFAEYKEQLFEVMERYLGGEAMRVLPMECHEYLRWVSNKPMLYTLGTMPYRMAVGFEFLLSRYGTDPRPMLTRGT